MPLDLRKKNTHKKNETCSPTMRACGLIESSFYLSIFISHDSGSPSTGALVLI